MKKYLVNICLVGVAVFTLSSCAKKSSTATESAQTPDQQQARQQRPGGQRQGPPQFSQLLSEMDTDKDGMLSASEVKGRLKDNFSQVDTNQDGMISETEFKNAPRPERPRRN